MAVNSTFTPKASLTEAPTNLKEAIDWVLRVTGRDGKENKYECICGLAAAVTDLLQSVQLEYHGYQGDTKDSDAKKGATSDKVKEHLNELFSLVQGLGGTAVVRTYIDQLAQVLSALVGWSKIEKCPKNSGEKCQKDSKEHHGLNGCKYLEDIEPKNTCDKCGCMKWDVPKPDDHSKGHHLGRGCKRCKDSSGGQQQCQCSTGGGGGDSCTAETCKCAKEGKCCKCCCNGQCKKCNKECSCDKEDKSYKSAYRSKDESWVDGKVRATWTELKNDPPGIYHPRSITVKRHQCARILLGSVCLIWSGITYMYWTGKWHGTSPRWNNHILDGTGLDDGTLSQWLQALGFPKDMLNNHGPGNRLDAVIWDGLSDKLLLGFAVPSGSDAKDYNDNTARKPAGMNYAGLVHTIHRDSFNSDAATVFRNGTGTTSGTTDQVTETNQHKRGALFKLYILSCAYFTGLQNKTTHSTPRNPKTIREILYWLSALPYSEAYKDTLEYAKKRLEEVLKKPDGSGSTTSETQLKFIQTDRPAPITVDEYNLFAHFQAVTQYCPLVLIGIQGGIHSPKGTDETLEPAIHSLYANTECGFTYPTVDIQAYNQVVHYIRALFYQLYFLRKQCAVKVTCGGKWRECRYGDGVVSKGVISWMCLGCNPMEHDRKSRVEKVNGELDGVKGKDPLVGALKELLEKIGDVVVQLGNAQERLDRGKYDLEGVMKALKKVFSEVNGSDLKGGLEKVIEVVLEVVKKLEEGVNGKLKGNGIKREAQAALKEAKKNLETAKGKLGEAKKALTAAKDAFPGNSSDIDPCKNIVSATIDGLHKALQLLKDAVQQIMEATRKDTTEFQDAILYATYTADVVAEVNKHEETQKVSLDAYSVLLTTIDQLISIANSPKCPGCTKHSDKCGQPPKPTVCQTCLQPTTTGVPSPLQAFLEDRLPGFSCDVVRNSDSEQPYPPAASHLGHCNGSGQCCPLPMGFRGQFYSGSTGDMTGQRLYGILYFFSNENMMQSCVYTLVRVTAALSATTPQVLGDVFGFFRGGVGNPLKGKNKNNGEATCGHNKDPSTKGADDYFCGWCASGLRDEVKKIEWIPKKDHDGGKYRGSVGLALIQIKGDKGSGITTYSSAAPQSSNTSLSTLTKDSEYVSPLTGELYTAVSATFGNTYLSWVLYLSDALEGGLLSLASAFKEIECRGCTGCDPNKCKKGHHGEKNTENSGQCGCPSIVSCTGVLPVLYRHGFSYGNPFNLEGYHQNDGSKEGDYSIDNKGGKKHCHGVT